MNINASKNLTKSEDVPPSETSYNSISHPNHRRANYSKGNMSNFSKASFSVYTSNPFKTNKKIQDFSPGISPMENQRKISKVLRDKVTARNRTRIRPWKSLEASKFSNWSSYTKGR